MKISNSSRRGAILLQTLMMSLILALMAISVTRWVLNRYMGATRTYRATKAVVRAGGFAMKTVSNPNLPKPGDSDYNTNLSCNSAGTTLDGTALSCNIKSGVITITYDEDQ